MVSVQLCRQQGTFNAVNLVRCPLSHARSLERVRREHGERQIGNRSLGWRHWVPPAGMRYAVYT